MQNAAAFLPFITGNFANVPSPHGAWPTTEKSVDPCADEHEIGCLDHGIVGTAGR